MIDYELAHEISEKAEKDADLYEKEIRPLIQCIAYDNGNHTYFDGGRWELTGWRSIAYLKAKELASGYGISTGVFHDIFNDETIEEAAEELQMMFYHEIETETENELRRV